MGVRKRYNKWWVDFCFSRNRYRRPSPENSKAGALAWELVLKQRLARGEPFDPKNEETAIFMDFALDWFETYVKNNNKHSEIISKEMILRVHLVPHFGRMKLDEIGNRDVERYKSEKLKSGLSPKTINNHLAVFKRAFQCALEWETVSARPIIKMLKTPPQKYDFLTAEECQRLLGASSGPWQAMLTVALGTGLRFGELIALDWQDIDFAAGELIVKRAYAKGVLGSPKSNRERHIPLSLSVQAGLHPMMKKRGLVFPDPEGGPLKQHVCVKKLHSICRKAGLRKIGWHTLRHTFASHLAQASANIVAIQNLLGHSDVRTTMRYAHINGAVLREAIGILNSITGAPERICHNSVTGRAFEVKNASLEWVEKVGISAETKEKESLSPLHLS